MCSKQLILPGSLAQPKVIDWQSLDASTAASVCIRPSTHTVVVVIAALFLRCDVIAVVQMLLLGHQNLVPIAFYAIRWCGCSQGDLVAKAFRTIRWSFIGTPTQPEFETMIFLCCPVWRRQFVWPTAQSKIVTSLFFSCCVRWLLQLVAICFCGLLQVRFACQHVAKHDYGNGQRTHFGEVFSLMMLKEDLSSIT